MNPLAWLGRHSSIALASLVVIGIAVPQLGVWLKHYVEEAIILLLFVAFLRLDLNALRIHFKNPKWVIAATVWTMFIVPMGLIVLFKLLNVEDRFPELHPALVFQASASPLMAAPAFAMLLGLDATLVLITLVLSTALTPLLAPVYASVANVELSITPMMLGIKLLLILISTAFAGLFLQWLIGIKRLAQFDKELDGINVIVLLVFICAILGNIRTPLLNSPALVIMLTLVSFVLFFTLWSITYLVFKRADQERALAIALLVSNRNMGLIIAATASALPEMTWMYFAVAQLPIYFCPQILKPITTAIRNSTNR
ncbi:MAG: Na+-dependent transporter [Gammaproteobacteria bacterium]|nr:Na+-dependent transporter [Gammaproteobacteria bacterium]